MTKYFFDKQVSGHSTRWEEAVSLFEKGDRAGALFIFHRLAKEGCSPALVEIGNIYEQGEEGVEKDIQKAIEWYYQSVEVLDDPKAHLALGRIYLERGKSDKDFVNARYHLLLLQDTKEMGAFFGLGIIYDMGLGIERNDALAIQYYQRAIALGHILASRNLAVITLKQNPIKGCSMLLRACCKIIGLGFKDPNDPRLSIY